MRSGSEAVERAPGALERVHDIERSDGLALRVLSVRDRVTDNLWDESCVSPAAHYR